jgi:CP family cyanate transporter-like MFS transporter
MRDITAITRYRFVILSIIVLVGFTAGMNMVPLGPIVPLIIADYGISNSIAGLLSSIVFIIHVPLAIPASMLVGRVNLKTLIALGTLLSSAPILSFLATDSFLLLITLRAISSFGFLLWFPATGPLFMQMFHRKELPVINGALPFAFSGGMTIATFMIAPLSEILGWEVAISILGGLSLVGGVTWMIFGKARILPANKETFSHLTRRTWEIVRDRNTKLIAIGDLGPFALLSVSMAWLPTFYLERYGIPLTTGGVITGILSLSGGIALVLATLITARTSKRRPFLIIPGILTGFAGLASLLLGNSIAIYFAVASVGFVCWFYIPALLTIPMDLYPNDPRRVSLILGTIMGIGGIAGAVAAPTAGIIADLTGSLMPGLAIFAVLGWSLAVAGILLPEPNTLRANSED